jgi:hypothetical protein
MEASGEHTRLLWRDACTQFKMVSHSELSNPQWERALRALSIEALQAFPVSSLKSLNPPFPKGETPHLPTQKPEEPFLMKNAET